MPIEQIKSVFSDPELSETEIRTRINVIDHFEIARRLHQLPLKEKLRVFHLLDTDQKRYDLLYETDQDSRLELQEYLDVDYLARLLDAMPEDEATDIIKEHDKDAQEEILSKISPRDAGIIKDLIHYGEETAGALMAPNFYRVKENETAADILMRFKKEGTSKIPPYFYLVEDNDRLKGFFLLTDLLNVPANFKPSMFVRKGTPKVLAMDPCEKVANLMDHEQLASIPVVDSNNIMQGIVTFDDVIREMQDVASEDIFTMVGTAKVDPFAKKTFRKVLSRAPWLFTTFIGGLASALLLNFFKGTLVEFTTIIFFVPFVIGLAGSVGIQGATVIVRGLATGDIKWDNLQTVVKSELMVGVINGIVFGVLCGAVVTLFAESLLNSSPALGITVGSGVILAVGFASLIGSLAPILFLKMGIDPAISAGPVVTVINDIVGLTIYLVTAGFIFSFF